MSEEKARKPTEVSKTPSDHFVTAISAGFASAPFTGGLATYLTEYYPGQVSRQIEDFRQSLIDHAQHIDKLNCDQERLGSLVSQVLLEIPKSNTESKRQAFRAIILNYAEGKRTNAHELDAFIAVLSPLTDLEMELLRFATSPRREAIRLGLIDPAGLSGVTNIPLTGVIEAVKEDVILIAYDGLRNKHLIHGPELAGSAQGAQLCLGHLKLSQFGQRFLEWIEEPEA